MELEDLVGTHMLDGVDYDTIDPNADVSEYASVISFRLDGVVYTATEDPDDGWRSCMRELTVNESSAIKNSFEPIQVIAKMSDCGNILLVTDPLTDEVVLEVGTDRDDNYYPSFVSNFNPEAMYINKSQYFKVGYPDYSREALFSLVMKYMTDGILVLGPDGPEIDLLRLYCPNRLDGYAYSRYYPLHKAHTAAYDAVQNKTSIAEEETVALFYQLIAFNRNVDTLRACYSQCLASLPHYVYRDKRHNAIKYLRAIAELGLLVPYNEWNAACVTSRSVFNWLASAVNYNSPTELFDWGNCDRDAFTACYKEHPRIKQYLQTYAVADVGGRPGLRGSKIDLAKAIFLKDGDELITV